MLESGNKILHGGEDSRSRNIPYSKLNSTVHIQALNLTVLCYLYSILQKQERGVQSVSILSCLVIYIALYTLFIL